MPINEAFENMMNEIFHANMIQFIEEEYGIQCAILRDPVTEDDVLMRTDGEAMEEDVYADIGLYERGWFDALESWQMVLQAIDIPKED